jgi:FixJ family two-component response regulator
VPSVISIVDDDKSIGDALRRMLNSYGFDAVSFVSAREFLDAEERHYTGCMLLDVRMPEMSGLALYEHLISEGHNIPTIFMTACPTASERNRAIASGAISYLAKPLSEEILLDMVRDALQQSQTRLTPDDGHLEPRG